MARDWVELRQLFHQSCTYAGPDGTRVTGPDANVEVVRDYAAAFPDMSVEMHAQHAPSVGVAIIEFTVRGTNDADLPGIPTAGRRSSFASAMWSRRVAGRSLRSESTSIRGR